MPTTEAGFHVYPFDVHRLYGIEDKPKTVAFVADLKLDQHDRDNVKLLTARLSSSGLGHYLD